ncbi:MAG: N-acetylneuraminate synthase [Candidatus Gorgyraea atricola]|nr:N-acetylneuraminate synthase [Candidatus Gorgyraea atricola]
MKTIRIGNRTIGEGHPCFIIAEAGSNHDRELEQAFKLIDIAKDAGADAVKFQTYSAETLYSKKTPKPEYLRNKNLSSRDETLWDVIKKIEMPREWHIKLKQYCLKRDIIFMSTPFDLKAVDELEAVDILAYKIASFEITHLPLLEKVGKTGKPVILSTGMADISDIKDALDIIYKTGNKQVALLHCAINYPPRYEDLHLRAMDTMKEIFKVPVGFSDHTLGITSDIAAVARGACIIEKHFTLDRKLQGPDHPFALEPQELKDMVGAIRDTEKFLGSPEKKKTESEEELYRIGRRSLVAACNIPKGVKITREMLEVKRPGYGIAVKSMNELIGRVAAKNIEEDDILQWEMFS